MTKEEFAQKVADKFSEEITDLIFLYIENDRELMHDYLRLISDFDIDTVNMALGYKIKEKFALGNTVRNQSPKSKLIQSFTMHTPPNP